jgi:hypothetical protein
LAPVMVNDLIVWLVFTGTEMRWRFMKFSLLLFKIIRVRIAIYSCLDNDIISNSMQVTNGCQ